MPRWWWLRLCLLICELEFMACRHAAMAAPTADPGDGGVANGIFTNAYFALSYALPVGWSEGLAGPAPSRSGYYVLGTLQADRGPPGTLLIGAQDSFFADKAVDSVEAAAADFSRSMAAIDGMTVNRQISRLTIGDHPFSRVDFSGVGLYRALFITAIRCHLVSFHLTTSDPQSLAKLAASLNKLAISDGSQAGVPAPICLKNYAVDANLSRKVEPIPVGPRYVPIPVRIIIGADGGVEHVHVIRAAAEQRQSIETALAEWRFKPYQINGQAVEVETGLTFRFTSLPDGASARQ